MKIFQSVNQLELYEKEEIRRLTDKILDYYEALKEDIREEVKVMGGKVIEFEHDILMKQSKEEGRLEGRLEGRQEGRLEGKMENMLSTAQALIKLGTMSLENISMVTGLPLSKVQELSEINS